MAAHMTLAQISNGNPAYELFYRQVDPTNSGKVGAADAAKFLKKSGLSDSTLGKIWELSDSDHKGFLDKRGFFVALRLVASAQSGNDVSHNSLNQTVPAPKFRDMASLPLTTAAPLTDTNWAVRSDERAKFDGIFESLGPVKGLLSGDKVKPVLINSTLPLDILGRIWDLSDVDKDGHLDKEEFTVAMHLVYRAMEKEPVPTTLPSSLVPPSKRKKSAESLPGSVPVLPSSPFLMKEGTGLGMALGLRPVPATASTALSGSSHGRQSPLLSSTSSASLSPAHSFKSSKTLQPSTSWAVPLSDQERYNDIFAKADTDLDGLLGGAAVKDIFMNSGLPQGTLARIWSLADTKQRGKLSREQFSLAMHLIQQKVTKGVELPQTLTPDLIPPSERPSTGPAGFCGFTGSLLAPQGVLLSSQRSSILSGISPKELELTGNKELDDIIKDINQLQREKETLDQEIRENEETLRHKTSQLQDVQGELDRELSDVVELETKTRDGQEKLKDLETQRASLEDKLTLAKTQYTQQNQQVLSLQLELNSKEQEVEGQEKEASRLATDLYCLETEESQLQESIQQAQAKLKSILRLLQTSQDEMDEVKGELVELEREQQEVQRTIDEYSKAMTADLSELARFPELAEPAPSQRPLQRLNGGTKPATEASSSLRSRIAMFNNTAAKDPPVDPFKTEDPFKTDPFQDPFGGDPFKENDPFKSADPFAAADPFGRSTTKSNVSRGGSPFVQFSTKPKDSDPFGTEDPFASSSFGDQSGFADFGQMSKGTSGSPFERRTSRPPKKNVPPRPAPPPYSSSHISSGRSLHPSTMMSTNPSTPRHVFGSEAEQLEWAKRESEREEQERLRRLRQQEQEDLELAIALSKTLS